MSLNFKDVKGNIPQKYSLGKQLLSNMPSSWKCKLGEGHQEGGGGSFLPLATGPSLGMFLSQHLKNDCDGICS